MVKTDDYVIPGDAVGVVEELQPGVGTFERDGIIYAKEFGVLSLDEDEMEARVKNSNPPIEIQVNDVVYGVVSDIKSAMVIIRIHKIVDNDRPITGETEGSVHVSKISRDYVKEIGREFRIGDLVRAKVIQASPSIQLVTSYREYGVVKAYCMRCRRPLVKNQRALGCKECERMESRKMASDYGQCMLD